MFFNRNFLRTIAKYSVLFVFFLPLQQIAKAQQWLPLGPNDNNWPYYDRVADPSMDVDKNGVPYVVFEDIIQTNKIVVRKYNNGIWTELPSPGFVVGLGPSGYLAIEFGRQNVPYVAYADKTNNYKLTVKKFDGSAWNVVGTEGISVGRPYNISIEIDHDGKPYVAYTDGGNGTKVSVKKFNGNAWIDVGGSAVSTGMTGNTCLVLDNNDVPYLTYTDSQIGYKAVVKKYDGTAWINVGTPGISNSYTDRLVMALNKSGSPYLLVSEDVGRKISVKKYDGNNWVNVGTTVGGAWSLAIDANDDPWVITSEGAAYGFRATMKRFDGINWVYAEPPGFSAAHTQFPQILFDADGYGYIIYQEDIVAKQSTAYAQKLTVKKFDGHNWKYLGDPGFSERVALATKVIVAGNGLVYAGFAESNLISSYPGVQNNQILKKYNGRDWETVGNSTFPVSAADLSTQPPGQYNASPAVDHQGIAYMAYPDRDNSGRVTIKKFDGTNWVTVGVPGISGDDTKYAQMVVDRNNIPYVAYADGNGGFVKYFNGTSWEILGGVPFSSHYSNRYLSMTISDNGTVYVSYADGEKGGKLSVKKFVPGTGWTTAGTLGFSSSTASFTNIVVDGNGIPYVAYSDGSGINVVKYTGTSWVTAGSQGISGGGVNSINIIIDKNNVLYLTYSLQIQGDRAIVKKFDGNDWVTVGAPAFSAVEPIDPSIAVTPTGVLIYVYGNVQAYAKSYSLYGSPIDLGILKGEKTPEQTSRLTWDTHNEKDILYFIVEYSSNGQDFQSIGSVNAKSGMGGVAAPSQYEFIHNNPVKGANYYRVRAIGAYGFEKLTNTVQVNIDARFLALVFPNPLTDQSILSVFLSERSKLSIRLLDITGRLLWSTSNIYINAGSYRLNVPLTKWPHGVYLLEAGLSTGERQTIRLVR